MPYGPWSLMGAMPSTLALTMPARRPSPDIADTVTRTENERCRPFGSANTATLQTQ